MRLPTSTLPLLLSLLTLSVTAEFFPRDVLVIGGKGATDVKLLGLYGFNPEGNCSAIPDIHFEPLYAIGLRDNQGRAMVCGGSKNPNPKSCWILDRTLNEWIEGPKLKRQRIGASATCLPSGICWVFGGRSTSFTEYYDPDLNEFVIGPKMPVNSAHGLCTAYGPISNYIYMAARREPERVRRFRFDPVDLDFDEYADPIRDEIRYPACAVAEFNGNDEFVVLHGGSGFDDGNELVYFTNPQDISGQADGHPHEIFGSVAVPLTFFQTFFTIGGVNRNGDYETFTYTYNSVEKSWDLQVGLGNLEVVLPVVVVVDHEDCPPYDNCPVSQV